MSNVLNTLGEFQLFHFHAFIVILHVCLINQEDTHLACNICCKYEVLVAFNDLDYAFKMPNGTHLIPESLRGHVPDGFLISPEVGFPRVIEQPGVCHIEGVFS